MAFSILPSSMRITTESIHCLLNLNIRALVSSRDGAAHINLSWVTHGLAVVPQIVAPRTLPSLVSEGKEGIQSVVVRNVVGFCWDFTGCTHLWHLPVP